MGLRPHPNLTMPYEPDYDPDFEAEDHRMAEAEAVAERRDAPGYRSCRPQPCPQCSALWPVVDALVARGHFAILETQMGGGVHAVRVWLDPGWLLANEECFSFYGGEDDDDGYGHTFYSTDDPPNAEQQAVLIDLAIASTALERHNRHTIAETVEAVRRANDPWNDVPGYPASQWQAEVAEGATRLGYLDWASERCSQGLYFPERGTT